jgi:hypothetical protein
VRRQWLAQGIKINDQIEIVLQKLVKGKIMPPSIELFAK